jgi:hypothetical protein
VSAEATVHHIRNATVGRADHDASVRVSYVRPHPGAYRPGAPL